MVLIRQFDKKAVALQRTGQMGTYASSLGQEAISTAIGHTMHANDVLAPYYRDFAAQYMRGVPLHKHLHSGGGDEFGNQFSGNAAHDFAELCSHCNTAQSCRRHCERHENSPANIVRLWSPVVMVRRRVEISTKPSTWQAPGNCPWSWWSTTINGPFRYHKITDWAHTIAHKAYAAGIDACRVDGNDIAAMFDAMRIALDTAWHGKGATLIEAVSYRLCDHTTADDATRYRNSEELKSTPGN